METTFATKECAPANEEVKTTENSASQETISEKEPKPFSSLSAAANTTNNNDDKRSGILKESKMKIQEEGVTLKEVDQSVTTLGESQDSTAEENKAQSKNAHVTATAALLDDETTTTSENRTANAKDDNKAVAASQLLSDGATTDENTSLAAATTEPMVTKSSSSTNTTFSPATSPAYTRSKRKREAAAAAKLLSSSCEEERKGTSPLPWPSTNATTEPTGAATTTTMTMTTSPTTASGNKRIKIDVAAFAAATGAKRGGESKTSASETITEDASKTTAGVSKENVGHNNDTEAPLLSLAEQNANDAKQDHPTKEEDDTTQDVCGGDGDGLEAITSQVTLLPTPQEQQNQESPHAINEPYAETLIELSNRMIFTMDEATERLLRQLDLPGNAISGLGYLKAAKGLRRPTVLERWSPLEIALFQAGIAHYGKQFELVQKEVATKTVQEVIDFYLIWKKTSHYRAWKKEYVPPHLDVDCSLEEEPIETTK